MKRRQIARLAAFCVLMSCAFEAGAARPACETASTCFALLEDPLADFGPLADANSYLMGKAERDPNIAERLYVILGRGPARVRLRAAFILNLSPRLRAPEATLRAAIEYGLPDLGRLYLRSTGSSGIVTLRTTLGQPATDVEDVVDSIESESPPFAVRIAIDALRCGRVCEFADPVRVAHAVFEGLAGQDHIGGALDALPAIVADARLPVRQRAEAIDAFFWLASAATLDARRKLLHHWLEVRDDTIRWHAAVGLANRGDARGIAIIAQGLAQQPLQGLGALSSLGTDGRAASRAIVPLLGRPGPVGVAANEALALVSPDEFCRTAESLREQVDPWVMRTYVRLIAASPDPACRLSLRRLPRFWHPGIAALIDSIAKPEPPDPGFPGFEPVLCRGHSSSKEPSLPSLEERTVDEARAMRRDVEFDGLPVSYAPAEPTGWWLALTSTRPGRPARIARYEQGRLPGAADQVVFAARHIFARDREIYASGSLERAVLPPALPESLQQDLFVRIDRVGLERQVTPLIYLPFHIVQFFRLPDGRLTLDAGTDGYVDLSSPDRPAWLGCDLPEK